MLQLILKLMAQVELDLLNLQISDINICFHTINESLNDLYAKIVASNRSNYYRGSKSQPQKNERNRKQRETEKGQFSISLHQFLLLQNLTRPKLLPCRNLLPGFKLPDSPVESIRLVPLLPMILPVNRGSPPPRTRTVLIELQHHCVCYIK